ncbi:MAG: YceD family protein [Rhodanobacter sp.]
MADTTGSVAYTLDFGRDTLLEGFVDVHAEAALNLTCQRTLEPFVLPISVDTRLGLIRDEEQEASLPPDCEPLLVSADGQLSLADVIEDELLLALPLVPINPDSALPDALAQVDAGVEAEHQDNPFAVLRGLKK